MLLSHCIKINLNYIKLKHYFFYNNKLKKKLFIFILSIVFIITQKKESKNVDKINNNERPKISIFMPIYNKELYVLDSIANIQNQTLKDIEIIAVNDVSTDNTLKLIKKRAKNDRRIKIINNDRNHGLLYSRAMGIINSTGEYVLNLDPDDLLSSSSTIEYLYKIAKKSNVDTIKYLLNRKSSIHKKDFINHRKLYEINKINDLDIMKDGLITNKFVKREVIIKCYNEYKDKIFRGIWNYHEDHIWSILIYKYSKSVIFIKEKLYLYFQYKESLMHNRFNLIEMKNITIEI